MRRSGGNPRARYGYSTQYDREAYNRGIDPELVTLRDDRLIHTGFNKYNLLTNVILDPSFFGVQKEGK